MQRLLLLHSRYDFTISALDYGKVLATVQPVWQRWNLALMGGAVGVVGVLLLNGAMAAIALVSIGAALGVYLRQLDRLHVSWLPWRRWWRPANRPLTLALLSLGGVFLIGIGLLQLWQRSPWPGLITLVLVQTLLMAIALLRYAVPPRPASPVTLAQGNAPNPSPPEYDAILTALATDHPVQQLVAIRQALRWASTTSDAAAVDDIADCLTMLLRRQPDPCVQRSLQRGLAQIRPLSRATQPQNATAALPSSSDVETFVETFKESRSITADITAASQLVPQALPISAD